MKRIFITAILLVVTALAFAQNNGADKILGVYLSENKTGKVQITQKDGKYIGTLVWTSIENAKDEKNPDASSETLSYDISAGEFAESYNKYLDLGFTIFGGCCGTDPDYIREICTRVSQRTFRLPEKKHIAALCSGTRFVPADRR